MCKRLLVLTIALMLVSSASADLVGYWPLDGDGTDASGYDNHGTIYGNVTPTADRFGNPNGAMYFAGGGGDRIDVGDPPELQISGAMTITAWVYLDSTNPVHGRRNGRIIAKMGGGGRRSWSAGIEREREGKIFPATIQVAGDPGTVISLYDGTLPVDQWVHYAGVYRPGESMEVYLNGELADIKTDGVPSSQYSNNGVNVFIGNRPEAGDCGWYGALDEVRVYNEALSEAEIEAVMAIPEPATVLLLGLGGLALIRKR